MVWAKLDDGFFDHPKARAAGKDGRAMFLASLCFATGNLTDGRITSTDLPLIAAKAEVKALVAKRLVQVGLWDEAEGGWEIHDFGEYQPTREQVEAERRAARERQQRWRESRRYERGHERRDNGRSDAVSSPSPTRPDPNVGTNAANQRPMGPDPGGGGAVDDRIDQAARVLAQAEAERRGAEIGNPAGYVRSRVRSLRDQHEPHWRTLLDQQPELGVDQLVAAVTSRRRADPTEATAAAAHRLYERNNRRRAGQTCPTCDGDGLVLDDHGTAMRCPDCGGEP